MSWQRVGCALLLIAFVVAYAPVDVARLGWHGVARVMAFSWDDISVPLQAALEDATSRRGLGSTVAWNAEQLADHLSSVPGWDTLVVMTPYSTGEDLLLQPGAKARIEGWWARQYVSGLRNFVDDFTPDEFHAFREGRLVGRARCRTGIRGPFILSPAADH